MNILEIEKTVEKDLSDSFSYCSAETGIIPCPKEISGINSNSRISFFIILKLTPF